MGTVIVDDHLLRDVLVGSRSSDLDGRADHLATTGLWLFRLSSAWAAPSTAGKLSAPLAALSVEQQARFVAQLVAVPATIEIVHLRHIAWPMAQLQHRHRGEGRPLSAAMVEALAAAHALDAAIAVSERDVGPNLQAAAAHDGITFHIL